MKSIYGSVLFVVALFAANLLHAQLNSTNLTTIEATTPLPANEMPASGTFYSAANPGMPPLPANMFGLSGWDLGGGIYLLDDLDGSPSGFHPDDSGPPGPGGSGGSTNNIYGGNFIFSTNGLWLSITNVADNTVYANLNNATDIVYEIFSTTNLATGGVATNWDIETEVFPCTNTTVMPFTTCMDGRPNLFLWARDWTVITSNGNETPDWWFYYWFGVGGLGLLDTNTDIFGNTLLDDFNNLSDPDYITYSLQYTNLYSVANPVGLTISLQTGIPVYEAVLVNDTNASDAVWKRFTSTNLTVNLSNGLCTVYVGLRGRPSDAQVTWRLAELTLNSMPLTLTVTNPASDTIAQPMIQVQGFASKPLASLTFDVSNASGIFTNQTGCITSQYCDTNLEMVTTNYFQCYDVGVASGLNLVTLHATDTAGETASTSESFTLDYSSNTNPPALGIIWPPEGTVVSGTNFNLQAQVDDDTATVTAQITDQNGDTNTVQGLVERSGLVWGNNLPLAAGTNVLTVTATDAGGYSSTTNLTLVQSAVTVTVNPLSGSNLNQSSVTVTGTVSDTNETVYVNGVQANVHPDGTWTACMVPVSANGTAAFNVQAYSSDSMLDGSQTADQEQPPTIVLADYQMQTGESSAGTGENQNAQWDYLAGGNWGTGRYPNGYGTGGGWLSARDPVIPPDGPDYTQPVVTSDQGETFAPTWQISNENITEDGDNLKTFTKTTLEIIPEGQATVGVTAYYVLQLAMNEFSDLENDENVSGLNLGGANQGDLPDPPEWVMVNGQTLTGMHVTNADGTLPGYVIVSGPAGTPLTVTLASTQYYMNNDQTFPQSDVQIYQLVSRCVATTPVNQARTNIGVCEQVNLFFLNPVLMTTNVTWSTTAGSLSVTSGITNQFTAPDIATNVTVTATVANIPINLYFQVYAPTGGFMENIPGTLGTSTNPPGVAYAANWYMLPDTVSFYNIQLVEGVGYSIATGYFYPSENNIPHYPGAAIQGENVVPGKGTECQFPDEDSGGTPEGLPYTNGTFTLPIPWSYVTPDGETNYFVTVDQIRTLTVTSSNAVLTLQKLESSGSVTNNF
jgi:hypothetical protein